MSKKINLGSINEETLFKLSLFNSALYSAKDLKVTYKTGLEENDRKITEKTDVLQEAIERQDFMTVTELNTEIADLKKSSAKLELDYKKGLKTCAEYKKSSYDLIEDNMYYAYVLTMQKHSTSAIGTVKIKKGRKFEEAFLVEKSYKAMIKDFLTEIGCKGQDNDTALNKFTDMMFLSVNGMIRSNKSDEYIKIKSMNEFKELFMRAFLQYTIVEKGIISINEDYSLSMTVYDETK